MSLKLPGILLIIILGLSCETEKKGNKKIDFKRESFSFQYPDNWYIDTKDEDYDPDAIITVDATDEGNYTMFMIFDSPIVDSSLLESQEEVIRQEIIKKPGSRTVFTNWGNFEGNGIEIRGKIFGIFKGSIRIFTWKDSIRSMLVMEFMDDKKRSDTEEGFKLIRETFRFN